MIYTVRARSRRRCGKTRAEGEVGVKPGGGNLAGGGGGGGPRHNMPPMMGLGGHPFQLGL